MNDDTISPVVGVYNGDVAAWENFPSDDIDLDYELSYNDRLAELQAEFEDIDPDVAAEAIADAMQQFDDDYDYDGWGTTRLIGAWALDEDGKYAPIKNSAAAEDDFAAIYDSNDNIMQVVWSRHVRYGRWASLCYPGQADARVDDPTAPDEVRYVPYYALPPELIYGGVS